MPTSNLRDAIRGSLFPAEEFRSVEHIDATDNCPRRQYFYGDIPCTALPLTSAKAKQLAGYSLIEKDLRNAIFWAGEIEKRHNEKPHDNRLAHNAKNIDNYNLIKGLFVAMLTIYGKCFAGCEGRRAKLDRRIVDEKYLDLHDRCISYRNNFAAHSGAERLERVSVVAVVPNSGSTRSVTMKVFRELDQPDLFWPTSSPTLAELFESVRAKVVTKIDSLATLVAEEAKATVTNHIVTLIEKKNTQQPKRGR
jgi:hypothetical protein